MVEARQRCAWVTSEPYYMQYHDEEWGVPVHDDQKLFEMLILEGAQAGLNWKTILKRRDAYRKAFHDFEVVRLAALTDSELEARVQNPEIIRNRLKIFSVHKNAQAFLRIQREFGSFDAYVWSFVGGTPLVGRWQTLNEVPASTAESRSLSKDLQKRGMTFVGETIMCAFMQAVGLVCDHTMDCWRFQKL